MIFIDTTVIKIDDSINILILYLGFIVYSQFINAKYIVDFYTDNI